MYVRVFVCVCVSAHHHHVCLPITPGYAPRCRSKGHIKSALNQERYKKVMYAFRVDMFLALNFKQIGKAGGN